VNLFGFIDEFWRMDALCAQTDPDLFFPEVGERNPAAKAVCGRCAVRQQCLAVALDNREPYGIWGGLSADERKRFRAQRNRDAS
jgi:WhiB family transcriptional regulator, redox-sensing transcriptional regulator